MSLEGLVTDSLNLPGLKTLRHVSSNGQHTYESVSTDPYADPCCSAPNWSPNGTKRLIKSAEILDGVDFDGLRGSIFGLGELWVVMRWLWRLLTKRRPVDEEMAGIPLSTLSAAFRDPLRW